MKVPKTSRDENTRIPGNTTQTRKKGISRKTSGRNPGEIGQYEQKKFCFFGSLIVDKEFF